VTISVDERFDDTLAAIERCRRYRVHLSDENDEHAAMALDATLRNLAVIGEAVRALPEEATRAMPNIPWASIAGPHNIVVHEYFRVDYTTIIDVVDNYLTDLAQAIAQ